MKIVSIEPTPSPNNMKLNMDESLPAGKKLNYGQDTPQEDAPGYIQRLLAVEGVKSVFQVADFISVERHPKADWKDVLSEVEQMFADETSYGTDEAEADMRLETDSFGETSVFVQMFKGIPIQAKLVEGEEEIRVPLPERFMQAAMKAQEVASNIVLERKWEEYGSRYGDKDEVAELMAQEIDAAYDEERLQQLVSRALAGEDGTKVAAETITVDEAMSRLDDADWKKRYAAVERLSATKDTIPVLRKALDDPKMSVRRIATAYLGAIEDPEVLPHLFCALQDRSATVRRTAGDSLSDLEDPAAIGPMAEALKDRNKIVRWRAARFLFEVGDESALPALRDAQDDPEFEVQLQVKMALERIEKGEEASGSIWRQMTEARMRK